MRLQRRLTVLLLVILFMIPVAVSFSPSATALENKVSVGSKASSFSVETLADETVTLGDFQGKVLILDFFASWCHVCKNTTPELSLVRENFGSENLAILSIESSPEVSIENVRHFKSEYGGSWPFAKAPSVADNYGVEAYPTIFVVDPDGYVAFRFAGAVPPDVLSDIVADTLGGVGVDENRPENRPEATNMFIDVEVEPKNAGGIIASSLEIKENGAPLFTYQVRPNPGYEFDGWVGEDVPENQKNSLTLKIIPIFGTQVTANFSPVEGETGQAPGASGSLNPIFFILGVASAGSLGVLSGYLAWGRKKE